MGGRGSASAKNQASGGIRARENEAQYREAQLKAERTRVFSALRFTNSDGTVTESMLEGGKWVDKSIPSDYNGRIGRAGFDTGIEKYAQMSTEALKAELKTQEERSNDGYWRFSRAAASKAGSGLTNFADADDEISRINQVLTRREKGVPQTDKVRPLGRHTT